MEPPSQPEIRVESKTGDIFPQRGGTRKSDTVTDSVILLLAIGLAISGAATYWLWPAPGGGLKATRRETTVRNQKRQASVPSTPAPPGAAAEPSARDDSTTGATRFSTARRNGRRPIPLPGNSGSAQASSPDDSIQVGMLRANLVDTFGKPELSAHTIEQKHLMEIYVYLEDDGRATFVLLEDGKVISSYTGRLERSRTLSFGGF